MRQGVAIEVQHPGFGHFFSGGNQRQGFGGHYAVVEHHRSFHGVVDRAGDQVQVVIGIDPQGQHAQQGQGYAGHGDRHQCHTQVPATKDRT